MTMSASLNTRGLIRSIAHRLAGESRALPVEGRLASFAGATGWLNSEPLTTEGLRWLDSSPSPRTWTTAHRPANSC